MALLAAIEFNGLVNDEGYWRLSSLAWSIAEPLTVRLALHGYASQQAYLDGKPVIKTVDYPVEIDPTLPDDDKMQILGKIRELGYLEAKALPDFTQALDV